MAKIKAFGLLSILGFVLIFASCGVNNNVMFKEAKEDLVNIKPKDSIPLQPYSAYRIGRNDRMTFTVSSNDGTEIIESQVGLESSSIGSQSLEYTVRLDGFVELPVLGKVHVDGLTIEECEDTIQALFARDYKDLFVQVKITNQRVVVFPGNGSDAKVITLENSNTTLMEVIALAGGITDRGKANTIKIMRRVGDEREVYQVDLSTIDGLKYADMIMQANDYVYVEPTAEIAKELKDEVIPVISLLSTLFFIFATIITF